MKKHLFLWLSVSLGMSAANAASFNAFDDDLLGFNAALSGQSMTVLDFENLSKNDILTNQFTESDGITFSDGVANLKIQRDLFTSDPIDRLGVKVAYSQSTFSSFTSVFSQSVNAFGAYFIDNGHPLSVTLFDDADNLLSSFNLSRTGESDNSAEWWGVTSDESIIAKAIFTASNKRDGFGFDNFTYSEVSNVPVPAAVWLFGSGLLGLIGIRKKPTR